MGWIKPKNHLTLLFLQHCDTDLPQPTLSSSPNLPIPPTIGLIQSLTASAQ